jgi:hypothetical protein
LKPGSAPALSESLGKHECNAFAIWNGLQQGGSVSPLIFTFVSECTIINGLQFNWVPQVLVFAVGISLLVRDINTRKNNVQCLRTYYCYCCCAVGGGDGVELPYFPAHKMHPDFLVRAFRKNNDECILILVIYWKKTGLLRTKISNHNIVYSS